MLFTIGYSGFYKIEEFIKSLKNNNINLLIDIRTFPYSKTFPQYDEKTLKQTLNEYNIDHLFLGKYLGGLKVKTLVKNKVGSVEDLLEDKEFKEGMRTLYKLTRKNNVCIMCAEKEPFNCHRLCVSYLFNKKTQEEVINIFPEKLESLKQTINRFKKDNNLDKIDIDDDKLISERFKLLYKIQNKREERFPKKLENLKLF